MSALLLLSFPADAAPPSYATRDLMSLSLEELASIEVSSVSKKPEKLSQAAASVFVITAEDIRRSGATSLPEALRLAPNLLVARRDANSYAISARGFNSGTANKLQVLIDGRIAYTPLYSGVFWDIQDVLLQDVERIEVISGPGAITWGSNAVNGVINVISRSTADTQGGLAVVGAGNTDQGMALRHGGSLARGGHYRIYGKALNVDDSRRESGGDAQDAQRIGQLGFRADLPAAGEFSVQGDLYDGRESQPKPGTVEVRGFNLLTRWQHTLAEGSRVQLQAYYDRTEREQPGLFAETLDILDVEMQHHLSLGERHDIVWGAGYRSAWDDVRNSAALAFLPAKKQLSWHSLFLQDEIQLQPDLRLTLGGRLEHNTYSHLEFMPNIRLAWDLNPQQLLWTSLARSVRTPSRLDRELFAPAVNPSLAGGADFNSEVADSLEIGFRNLVSERFSVSATAFYHSYDNLRTVEPIGGGVFVIDNGLQAETYGIEFWGGYQLSQHWRISGGGMLLQEDLHLDSDSNDVNGGNAEANDPSNQWLLRSSLDLGAQHELDLTLRHVGKLSANAVPAYTALDIRLGWQPLPETQLSLTARNLLDSQHPEFDPATSRSEVERSIYVQLLQRF
jgi:iron complex outermembrane receptor protein